MKKEVINLQLTEYELAILTCLIMSLRKDKGEELFDDLEGKAKEIAKEAYASLSCKVLMSNMEYMASNCGAMDAEILAEDADE